MTGHWQELIEHVRQKLADYKRPKQIHITETIPRTATGKVQRLNVAAELAGARG